jgi:hypothetical protein
MRAIWKYMPLPSASPENVCHLQTSATWKCVPLDNMCHLEMKTTYKGTSPENASQLQRRAARARGICAKPDT